MSVIPVEERQQVLAGLVATADRIAGSDLAEPWDIGPVRVPGQPRPQGSKKAIMRKGMKRPVMVESSPHVGTWRDYVREAVAGGRRGDPMTGPVEVRAVFEFLRPASHHVANDRSRPLRPDAPRWCTSHAVGDLDKLQRAIGDALTGIAWADDALIVRWDVTKEWSVSPSVTLSIRGMR